MHVELNSSSCTNDDREARDAPASEAPQQTDSPTDGQLMARIAAGDGDAFQELVKIHGPQLATFIGRLTAWHADRDDLLQETLLAVWDNARGYDERGKTAQIENDEAALPRELRHLNLEGRSQLASHLVQSLFDTKLDLAVNEETIARVEEMKTERDEESIQHKQLELQAASAEFESAIEGAALAARDLSKGLGTSVDVGRSKTAAELARLKVQICENALQAELMKQDRSKAEQLTQLRLQQKPLQAKLETLDGFMNIMQISSEPLRTIEQKRQERELILRDLAWVASEIGPRSLELLELENLLRLAKERVSASAPTTDQQPAVPQPADATSEPSDH